MPVNNLAGRVFGRLTVIERGRDVPGSRHAHWRCRCECGKEKVVRSNGLTSGRTVSCGCLRADPAIRQAARLQVAAKKRKRIARMGGLARWGDQKGE